MGEGELGEDPSTPNDNPTNRSIHPFLSEFCNPNPDLGYLLCERSAEPNMVEGEAKQSLFFE
jgi:hypothetical protein